MKVFISTVPFAAVDATPVTLLEKAGIEYELNPIGRKLTELELEDILPGFDAIIAGTEPITSRVIQSASDLKIISRVGVGLDSVDLISARENDVLVCYTPEAPAPAVVDLTMGLMYSLLRHVHTANLGMHRGKWERKFGNGLTDCRIGIIGNGRIGSRVIMHLEKLGVKEILVNDLERQAEPGGKPETRYSSKEEIYQTCDLVSLHVPLTTTTRNLITKKELALFQPSSYIINTSRGGVINEADLCDALRESQIAGAAIDVFCEEPYTGPLNTMDNCLLTSHMGSMTQASRSRMEIEATSEIVRFFEGRELQSIVPEYEYENIA